MSIEFEDPGESMEFAIDDSIRNLFAAASILNIKRHDHNARPYIKDSMPDIEIVRDKLSTIIDDVRGVS